MSLRRNQGFTLLEICLAVAIGLLILGIAVPSVEGVFAEQRLKESYDQFDELVRKAQSRAISEQRAFVLVWEKEGIVLEPLEPRDDEHAGEGERMGFSEKQSISLKRPAAMGKDAPAEWTFWRSGLCEPAVVTYEGPEGAWTVEYNALTGRGTFLDQTMR